MRLHLAVELVGLHEERHRAVRPHHGEAERHRRVRQVRAADVEEPGDAVGLGQHRRVGPRLGDGRADPAAPVGRALAGELLGVHAHRAHGLRRAVLPDLVDRVRLEGDEPRPALRRRAAQPVDLGLAVQPGVVADGHPLAQRLLEPLGGGGLAHGHHLEEVPHHLPARLQRVAPVDEERRPVGQHDGEPRRAGEPGEVRQPLVMGGHHLVLVRVGARHEEAVDAPLGQPRAQGPEPLRRGATVAPHLECLEHASATLSDRAAMLAPERDRGQAAFRGRMPRHAPFGGA